MVTMLSRGTIAESRSGARFMLCAVALAGLAVTAKGSAQEKHFLYVAAPGIRDHLEFGGAVRPQPARKISQKTSKASARMLPTASFTSRRSRNSIVST